jgi:hypothetical protein
VLAIAVAAALAIGAAACGGDDEETTTPAQTTPTGAAGAGGAGENGASEDEPGASAQREGAGTGLEENLSGSDVSGTEPPGGGEATTGDTTP